MKKTFKLLLFISLIFVLIGCTKDKKEDSSNLEVMTKEELWDKLYGYWTNNNTDFVVFTKDGEIGINFGTWFSEASRDDASITKFIVNDKTNYTTTIKFPKQKATLMNGPYDELIMDISIDISDLENNKIKITSSNGTVIYNFSGSNYQKAMESLED